MDLNYEIYKVLTENVDAPYEREEDKSAPKPNQKRKPVLTLRALQRLKKIRLAQREENARDSVFVPILYGPEIGGEEGAGGMGGLGGL